MNMSNMDGLKKVIENKAREKVQKGVSKIADELTVTALTSVMGFYGHYTPISYKRHGGLYSSFRRFYRNPHNTIYYGGVEILPSAGDYKVSGDYITELAYSGHHGNIEALGGIAYPNRPIKNYPPVMPLSPGEILERKKESIIAHIGDYFE